MNLFQCLRTENESFSKIVYRIVTLGISKPLGSSRFPTLPEQCVRFAKSNAKISIYKKHQPSILIVNFHFIIIQSQ